MSEYGVTTTGFNPKTYEAVRAAMIERAREYYGENLDERSTNPLIKFIEDISLELSYIWQVSGQVFNNIFITGASGIHLDKIGYELGLDRQPGSTSAVLLKITGQVGAVIPSGSQFKTTAELTDDVVTFASLIGLTIGYKNETYRAGPSETDTFSDTGGGNDNFWTTDETPYNDGEAVATFNGEDLSEVAWPAVVVAGEFSLNYGSSTDNFEVGNTLSTGDVVSVTYTYEASWNGTTTFTLDYIPVDPLTSLFRNSTKLTEVASAPGANEFSVNYTTGAITLGQTIVVTDVFVATYLDADATYDTVNAASLEVGDNQNVEANTIVVVASAVTGISAVNNESPSSGGSEPETDAEYRTRLVAFPRTQWTAERIEREVEGVAGVQSATVISSTVVDEFAYSDNVGTSPLTFELSRKPDEPLKRAEIQSSTGVLVLDETTGAPATGEFQVDYPSEVPGGPWVIEIFDSDMGAQDTLIVIYTDDDIGEGYFDCYVVGETSPIPPSILDAVRVVLQDTKPLSIGFTLLEPASVEVEFDIDLVLEEEFGAGDIDSIQSSIITELDTLIDALRVDEDLIRNEVIKIIMNTEGVEDIQELKITLIDETHVYATGVNTIDVEWGDFETILAVTNVAHTESYPYTTDEPNNQITLTGTPYPGNGETFVIKFESIEGNVTPRSAEKIKRGTTVVTA